MFIFGEMLNALRSFRGEEAEISPPIGECGEPSRGKEMFERRIGMPFRRSRQFPTGKPGFVAAPHPGVVHRRIGHREGGLFKDDVEGLPGKFERHTAAFLSEYQFFFRKPSGIECGRPGDVRILQN